MNGGSGEMLVVTVLLINARVDKGQVEVFIRRN